MTQSRDSSWAGRGSVPVPDPTKLTTDAVNALSEQLKELFGVKLDALESLMLEKFTGRDKALEAALAAQQARVEEQNKSNALAATKAESGFDKRIQEVSERMVQQTKSNDDRFSDLKDRLTAVESIKKGSSEMLAWIFGAAGVALAVVTALLKLSG
jgi:Flp pilus assembly protein TadB